MPLREFTGLAQAIPTATVPRTQQYVLPDALAHPLNGGVTSQATQIDLQADLANVGLVYVGNAGAQLVPLQKGQVWSFGGASTDVASIYVRGAAADRVNVLWAEVVQA